MKKRPIDIILKFGTLFLIIFSSCIPLVVGNSYMDLDEKQTELDFYRFDNYSISPNLIENNADYKFKDVELTKFSDKSKFVLDGPMDSPWSMQSHDTHHTGRSQFETGHNTDGFEKWRFLFTGWLEDTPVIDNNGIIYCKGAYNYDDSYLFAIYPDGTEKWRFKTNGYILGSSPSIDENGTIYIGNWENYLYAINSNGTQKWRFHAEDTIATSPAIGDDGTIYFGTMGSGCNIFAVNPDGTEQWRYPTGYYINSDPAIGDDGTIYIGSGDDYLYAMYPNGSLRWRFKTGDLVKGPVSIASDGTVYVGSFDDYLYAIYPNNGTIKWQYNVDYGTESNPSIGSDGTIYCGGKYLYAINPDGTEKWTFDFGSNRHSHQSSPGISAEGIIYIGVEIGDGEGAELIAVNPDGSERWRKHISGKWAESSPSIGGDGTVYIGSANAMGSGYLHAFGDVESNVPPNNPTIDGPLEGKFGEEYEYTFSSVDSDINPVSFYIDWDDGSDPSWTRDYASDENVKISHIWDEEGTYRIGVKARDTLGEESDWAYLEVTMPVNQQSYSFPLLQRLLELFPNAFPILRQIFRL